MRTRTVRKNLNIDQIAQHQERDAQTKRICHMLQLVVKRSLEEYMKDQLIGFNELVRRLQASPTQVAKILQGDANLTFTSFAHILIVIGKEPLIILKPKRWPQSGSE